MKNIYYLITTLLLAFVMSACQDELPELGELIPVSELKFTITQNPNDPNMVIIESLTPNVIPVWTTPMGRSTRVRDTVKLAFPNTYRFVYSVQGAGGLVSADTVNIEITTTNLSYVDNPLWNMLTGGVGKSKTWVLDLNAEGVSKYFNGPMYFFGTDNGWQEACLVEDGDCWDYKPDWKGNQWVADLGDYGQMTFDLMGGAHLEANHPMIPARGEENGTFFLNADNYTISTNNATVLHTPNYEDCVADWNNGRLFSLTEDYMQIAFLRKASCEGEALLVYNYISKEYSDNWVPEEEADPEPPYDGEANNDLTTNISTSKSWAVNLDYPYNWHNLGGVPLNDVATYGSDPEGFTFTTWTPPYDEAIFSAISVEFTKTGENDGTYVIETATDTYDGTYTVDASNNIDFGQPITFFSGVGGWLSFSTTAENTLRIINTDVDPLGNVTGIWLGSKDPNKDEYLSIHLDVTGGGAEPEEPEGTEVTFDNTKLVVGDLEGNGNLRLELYNNFGSTSADPPLDPTAVVFDNRVEITFTLQGVTLNGGAAGSYNASIGYADADFSPSAFGGGGPGDVSVTGDGTYTVYVDPASPFDTAQVFVIDISGMATDIADIASVSVTIDSIVLY